MNPFFAWVVAHSTLKGRVRKCPKCGNAQLAPRGAEREPLTCARCKATVPPPSRAARGR